MADTQSIATSVTAGLRDVAGDLDTPSRPITTLADNFQTFLTLLTTQLKNQNPLDPLDTNQFTQQLVQFAQVEQQLKSNDQLSTLVSLQQTAQATQALNFVGSTAVVDGSTAALTNGSAELDPQRAEAGQRPRHDHGLRPGKRCSPATTPLNAGNQAFRGTARATTAPSGPTAITRSRSTPRMPRARPRPSRLRLKAPSTRST